MDRSIASIKRRAQDPRARLMEQGVAIVQSEYNGYADDGMIEQIICRTAENVSVRLASQMREELIDLFYDLLETRFPYWEDNSGACGEFTWNLQTDTLHHQHNERFEDYETSELDGWDAAGAAEPVAEATETEDR